MISRADLVEHLAVASHGSWMRQKRRLGDPEESIFPDVTDHDRERAEDIVVVLEALGLYPPRFEAFLT
jgi:hypothetical protein